MNNNGNHGNKFFEGFIWGAIIGGAIVFLMGTKKGKKLLKAIADEGVGNFADILDEGIDENEPDEEELEETSGNGLAEDKKIQEPKSSPRKRFFRRRS